MISPRLEGKERKEAFFISIEFGICYGYFISYRVRDMLCIFFQGKYKDNLQAFLKAHS